MPLDERRLAKESQKAQSEPTQKRQVEESGVKTAAANKKTQKANPTVEAEGASLFIEDATKTPWVMSTPQGRLAKVEHASLALPPGPNLPQPPPPVTSQKQPLTGEEEKTLALQDLKEMNVELSVTTRSKPKWPRSPAVRRPCTVHGRGYEEGCTSRATVSALSTGTRQSVTVQVGSADENQRRD